MLTTGFHRNFPWSFLFSCLVPLSRVPFTCGYVKRISCVNVKCTLKYLPRKNPVKDKHLHSHISTFLSDLVCIATIINEDKRSVTLCFIYFFPLRRRNGILVGSLFVTWGPGNQQTDSTFSCSCPCPSRQITITLVSRYYLLPTGNKNDFTSF